MIVSDRFHVIKLVLESFIKTAYGLDKDLKKRFGLGRLLRKKEADLDATQRLKLESYFKTNPTIKILYDITQELMSLMNEKMCKFKDCKQRLIPKLLKFIELLKNCGFELRITQELRLRIIPKTRANNRILAGRNRANV